MTQHMRPDDPDTLMDEDELLQAVGDWAAVLDTHAHRKTPRNIM